MPHLKNSSLLVFSFRLKLSPPPAGVACCVCRLLFSSMSMAKRMAKPPVATAWPQRHGRIQWGLGGLEKTLPCILDAYRNETEMHHVGQILTQQVLLLFFSLCPLSFFLLLSLSLPAHHVDYVRV